MGVPTPPLPQREEHRKEEKRVRGQKKTAIPLNFISSSWEKKD